MDLDAGNHDYGTVNEQLLEEKLKLTKKVKKWKDKEDRMMAKIEKFNLKLK